MNCAEVIVGGWFECVGVSGTFKMGWRVMSQKVQTNTLF